MRRLLRYFFVPLLLLVVALISALTAMRMAIHVREVRVPDFRGKNPAEARRIADASGLNVQIESNYYSTAVPEGRVLSQGPAPGTLVRRGWDVQLALSLGPQRVTIPQVVGQSERAASITAAERGLQISFTDWVELPGSAAGQVIAQDPTENATEVAAPKISLLVNQEPSPKAFVMPSFLGQPLGSATKTLEDAGFTTGRVSIASAEPGASNGGTPSTTVQASPLNAVSPPQPVSPTSIIVAQDPPAGHKVLTGASINFVVR